MVRLKKRWRDTVKRDIKRSWKKKMNMTEADGEQESSVVTPFRLDNVGRRRRRLEMVIVPSETGLREGMKLPVISWLPIPTCN